jgi:hypothetical protein
VNGLGRPLLPAENSGWRSWWMEGEANAGYPWRGCVIIRIMDTSFYVSP